MNDPRVGEPVDLRPADLPGRTPLAGRYVEVLPLEASVHADDLYRAATAPGTATLWTYYAGGADPAATFARLKGLVRGLPRVSIEKDEPEYLHAVVRSLLFRFPDDIELELDGDLIHLRMASRVGHSDLGVNRKRAESLRAQLG